MHARSISTLPGLTTLVALASLASLACVDINVGDEQSADTRTETGGTPTGDGDGDPSTSTGDGDPSTGDGDPSTGDGDGDGGTVTDLEPGPLLGSGPVASLAPSPDGTRLVANFADKQVVVFDLADASPTVAHTIGDGDLFEAGAAAWGPEGFVVGTFNVCLVFDNAGALVHELPDRCAHVALSGDGATLIRTTTTGIAEVDLGTGVASATASLESPAGLAITDTSAHVLVSAPAYAIESFGLPGLGAGSNYAIDARGLFHGPIPATLRFAEAQLWPDFAGTPVTLATAGIEDQRRLVASPDLRWAASLGFSEDVHVWDASSGAKLASAPLAVTGADGIAFDPSSAKLFVGAAAGVQVYTLVFE